MADNEDGGGSSAVVLPSATLDPVGDPGRGGGRGRKKRRPKRANQDGSQARPSSRRDALATLVRCDSELSPEEIALLDEVFPQIVTVHHNLVRAIFRGLPEADIEDLVQDTFARTHAAICARGFPPDLPRALTNRARGKLANHLRAKRRNPLEAGLPSSSGERPASLGADERAAMLNAVYERVRAELSPAQREVLDLVILKGLSRRQAAAILRVPEGTIQKRVIAVRRAFAEALETTAPESEEGDE